MCLLKTYLATVNDDDVLCRAVIPSLGNILCRHDDYLGHSINIIDKTRDVPI